jgi:D-alanine-D-alanine ligase
MTHVAVLMGGWSPEREVSLVSGEQCAVALEAIGYRVSRLDVTRSVAQDLAALRPDVCFNALHGSGGEDGLIQGLLEVMQLPYTHSGVAASAIAMDKRRCKIIFAEAGIPVAADKRIGLDDLTTHAFDKPYVIKPIYQGSSVGIEMITDTSVPVPNRVIETCRPFGDEMMAEVFVPGRELTCGVMGEVVFDVLEITTARGFYDYQAKYETGGSVHEVPARIPADIAQAVQDYSQMAHQSLGCRGVTRTDFRYDADGVGLVALEINTQPGMTPVSLVPDMAAYKNIGFQDLVKWLVEDASCLR